MDTLSPERRSALMARIKGKDTKPEKMVRRLAFALGYRYRKHLASVPGSPDLAFKGRKKAIFVHGCYWHRHPGCSKAYSPKSNVDFWQNKFDVNTARDRRVLAALDEQGWETLVIWECETNDAIALERRLRKFLGPTSISKSTSRHRRMSDDSSKPGRRAAIKPRDLVPLPPK